MSTATSTVTKRINDVTITQVNIVHTKGDSLVIDYDMTPDSGSPVVPSSATLYITNIPDGTAVKSATASITDNTTSYNVRAVIESSDVDELDGDYYFKVEETKSAEPKTTTPIYGVLRIEER